MSETVDDVGECLGTVAGAAGYPDARILVQVMDRVTGQRGAADSAVGPS